MGPATPTAPAETSCKPEVTPFATGFRPSPAQALLVRGEVRHTRLRPAHHAFAVPTFYLLLPLRSLRDAACPALHRNQRHWLSWHDGDHGQGGPDALAWVEALLAAEGVDDADGEIWLQTYPRVLGYTFKPVSFWFAHRADGSLCAVVAEVNNTFGERHVYLLRGPELAFGRDILASKVFHVSPFCQVQGTYRFRFMRQGDRIVSRVELFDDAGPLLVTSQSGRSEPLTGTALRRAAWQWPWLTLGITVRIHWHALRLWLKRVPFFRKPEPPRQPVTRSLPSAVPASRI